MGQSWSQEEDTYLMDLMGSDGNYIPIAPGADPFFPSWPSVAKALALAFPDPLPGQNAPRTYNDDTVSDHWYYELKPFLLKKWVEAHPDMLYDDDDGDDGEGEGEKWSDRASASSGASNRTIWPGEFADGWSGRSSAASSTPRGSLVWDAMASSSGSGSSPRHSFSTGDLKRGTSERVDDRPRKKKANWENAAEKMEGDFAIAYEAVQQMKRQMKMVRGEDGVWKAVVGDKEVKWS